MILFLSKQSRVLEYDLTVYDLVSKLLIAGQKR